MPIVSVKEKGVKKDLKTKLEEIIIKVPRFVEYEVKKPKIVEETITVQKVNIVEREKIIERPVFKDVTTDRARFKDKIVEVPKIQEKIVYVEKPVIKYKEIEVIKPVLKTKIIEVEKIRIIDRPVVIERPVYQDRQVFNAVFKEVEVIVPKIREKLMSAKEAIEYQKKKEK